VEGSAKPRAVEAAATAVASASMTSRESGRGRSEKERCHQKRCCNCWSHAATPLAEYLLFE